MSGSAVNQAGSFRPMNSDNQSLSPEAPRWRHSQATGRPGNPRSSQTGRGGEGRPTGGPSEPRLPILLTVDEAAELLRTTRRAIYMMIERDQLPGLTRIGRRVLLRSADLLHWLDQKRAPSPKE